ncbi:DnaK suppressor protein/ C4-type zinc finger protein, DksA/TraR family [Cupriavidus basilensis OR16]|uniref:DnaK suppressor protein/ C4-type zinc finger protein, DksA/TraR family n=1 Tax=Cupriavidus basilensis OR16 TaxID=1127483 RepID=H1SDM5_9BURK|nr:TraR/DksA C4-type zinc finger protein [Cupriavidus basilensis]EHP39410.1 DnaK suppressor protein/ C4-type zinc finger protein, DksA/TraR family [Cupriavidus basilensis OR16]
MTPDIFDRATEAEERHREDAIAQARARAHATHESRADCAKCGEPIPEARRLAVQGCTLCIDCARWREQHQPGRR